MTTNWDEELSARIGQAVKALREQQRPKLSAAKLAVATERCGYAMTKAQISDLELGRKKTVTVPELITLARALSVPPVQLLYPNLPDGPVEVWPNHETRATLAAQWFSGERTASEASDYLATTSVEQQDAERRNAEPIRRSRQLEKFRTQASVGMDTSMASYDLDVARKAGDSAAVQLANAALARARAHDEEVREFVIQQMAAMISAGMTVMPNEGNDPAYDEAVKRAAQ